MKAAGGDAYLQPIGLIFVTVLILDLPLLTGE